MQSFRPGEAISLSASVELVEADARHLPHPLVLKKSLPNAPEQVTARFETAAQILPRLFTPHAPVLRASGLDRDAAYLLMDRVPGESLAEVLRRGALPIGRLLATAQALARAVHATHLQGVVHLHLLPSHVMVTPDGYAVLLSFGLAHHRECPDLLPGAEWVAAVSSAWMAPEQLYQVRDDPRSDQWSVGALIYQMAVGHPPFHDPADPDRSKALDSRLWRPLQPLRSLRPDLPDWLQEVVHRCLEIAPGDRYDHCGQVAWALTNPQTVNVHPVRARLVTPPVWQQVRRWWMHQRDPARLLKALRREAAHAAQLLVLLLPTELNEGSLPGLLRQAVLQHLLERPEAHLACLALVSGASAAAGQVQTLHGTAVSIPAQVPMVAPVVAPGFEDAGQRPELQAMARWARGLQLPASRTSFHLLPPEDGVAQITRFCVLHQADLLVLGLGLPAGLAGSGQDPARSSWAGGAGAPAAADRQTAEDMPPEEDQVLDLIREVPCAVHLVRDRTATRYQRPPSTFTR